MKTLPTSSIVHQLVETLVDNNQLKIASGDYHSFLQQHTIMFWDLGQSVDTQHNLVSSRITDLSVATWSAEIRQLAH